MSSFRLPNWYADVGATLPPGHVLLSYPLPFSGVQSSQAWQALNGMRYAQAGGGGAHSARIAAARASTSAGSLSQLVTSRASPGPQS